MLWRTDQKILAPGVFSRVYQYLEYFGVNDVIGGNWTIGTLPTMLSARQLWHHSSLPEEHTSEYKTLLSAGANWTLQTSQPVVMSICSPRFDRTDNIFYHRVNGSTSILQNATELYDTLLKMNESRMNPVLWIQMPQEPTSLLAFFIYNGAADGSETDDRTTFFVCTVSSFWWETSTTLFLTTISTLVQTDWPGSRIKLLHGKLRPIIINPEDITTLYTPEFSEDVGARPALIVAVFAAALSWVPGQDTNAVRDPLVEDMIEGKDWSSMKNPTSYTSFRILSMITGYGYGGSDTSTQLSLAVIVAYCFITIAYVTYIIVTGQTSVAWNSATELIMLALQSKEPKDLGHVSVGIDSIDTLRRSVGIRVNKVKVADTGEHTQKLELVFKHDIEDKRRILKKVERNQAY
jgi:hypothetical protein